ncbi:MAG: STAS domain-containing protein [Candidatus Muiribacteriota bacterium]|jgi:anti-sigma B factor antagonist
MDINVILNEEELEVTLEIAGEITINNFNELSTTIEKNMGKNIDFILDFSGVTYIDSAGIGGLVAKLKEIFNYGGNLKIINTPSKILKLFRLTKLDKFFEIY